MNQILLISKALTALISTMVMLRLHAWIDLDGLGLTERVQVVVDLTIDAVMSGFVGYMTYLIPFGRKYIEQHILGRQVVITNSVTGVQTAGEVTSVMPPQVNQ